MGEKYICCQPFCNKTKYETLWNVDQWGLKLTIVFKNSIDIYIVECTIKYIFYTGYA